MADGVSDPTPVPLDEIKQRRTSYSTRGGVTIAGFTPEERDALCEALRIAVEGLAAVRERSDTTTSTQPRHGGWRWPCWTIGRRCGVSVQPSSPRSNGYERRWLLSTVTPMAATAVENTSPPTLSPEKLSPPKEHPMRPDPLDADRLDAIGEAEALAPFVAAEMDRRNPADEGEGER